MNPANDKDEEGYERRTRARASNDCEGAGVRAHSQSGDGCPMEGQTYRRQSAKNRLANVIANMRTKADLLEALLLSLPTVMQPECDEALWQLIVAAERSLAVAGAPSPPSY